MDFDLQGVLNALRSPGALSDMADVNQMVQAGNGQIRNQALGSGLIGAGAGLLGYDKRLGPAAGLGQALEGFNKSYDTEMIANRPKVTPLADGAFSQITFPDGTVQIVGNKDVAKFLDAKYGQQAANKLVNTVVGAQAGVDAADAKDTNKRNKDEAGGVNTPTTMSQDVQNKLTKLDSLTGKIEQADTVTLPGTAQITKSGQAASFENPMIANVIDQTYGRATESKAYETRRELDRFLKEDVLAFVRTLGANPSEGDRKFLERKVPNQDDPTSYKVEYIKELRQRIADAEERRMQAAQRRDGGSGSGSMTPSAIPGLSSGAAKYFQ